MLTADPILTPAERAIIQSFGGWSDFNRAHGFTTIQDMIDMDHSVRVIRALAEHDEEMERSAEESAAVKDVKQEQ